MNAGNLKRLAKRIKHRQRQLQRLAVRGARPRRLHRKANAVNALINRYEAARAASKES